MEECIVKSRGTGAGGANTNVQGLQFEKRTDLTDFFQIVKEIPITEKQSAKIGTFIGHNKELIQLQQSGFFKYMIQTDYITEDFVKSNKLVHGGKKPDDAYVNHQDKTIIIIEKKMQSCSGSVCEKLGAAVCKLWSYQRAFEEFTIKYCFVLSKWFRKNCPAEIEFLKEIQIPFFWADKENWQQELIQYIHN